MYGYLITCLFSKRFPSVSYMVFDDKYVICDQTQGYIPVIRSNDHSYDSTIFSYAFQKMEIYGLFNFDSKVLFIILYFGQMICKLQHNFGRHL